MKKTILFFVIVPLLIFSQKKEKRLALVIGNSNYNVGKLNNPVNDAELIAKTLEKLDFDVILKTNLEDQRSFKLAVREFGKKRPNYEVGFIYYAGHGIQVDGQNYLLPTKELFESEQDVKDFALPVQSIIDHLELEIEQNKAKELNILVLDACRNNPFESKWDATRSLDGGSGLAKIPPPRGSLIAFSTDAGRKAKDGEGKNSLYCISLAKNMLKKNKSIFEVFGKVREEVELKTNGVQSPVEENKLKGNIWCFSGDCKPKKGIDFLKIFNLPEGWIDYTEKGSMLQRMEELQQYGTATEEASNALIKGMSESMTGLMFIKYEKDVFPGLIPEIKVRISKDKSPLIDLFYENYFSEDSLKKLELDLHKGIEEYGMLKNIKSEKSLSEIDIGGVTGIDYSFSYDMSLGSFPNIIDQYTQMTFRGRTRFIHFSYSGLNYELSFIDILPDPTKKKYTYEITGQDYTINFLSINELPLKSSPNDILFGLCNEYDAALGTSYTITDYKGEKTTNMGEGKDILSSFQNGYNCHCPDLDNKNLIETIIPNAEWEFYSDEDGDFVIIRGNDKYKNSINLQFHINSIDKSSIKIPYENGYKGDDCSDLFNKLVEDLKFD